MRLARLCSKQNACLRPTDVSGVANYLRYTYHSCVLGVTTTTSGRPVDFFARHPVFTYDEFAAAHRSSVRKPSPRTTMSLLRLHVAAGRLVRVRRGLYASVSPGADAGGFE